MVVPALLQCGLPSTLQRFSNLALCWTVKSQSPEDTVQHCILLCCLFFQFQADFLYLLCLHEHREVDVLHMCLSYA